MKHCALKPLLFILFACSVWSSSLQATGEISPMTHQTIVKKMPPSAPNLLIVLGSPDLNASLSREMGAFYQDLWRQKFPDGTVTLRDLAKEPPLFIGQETIAAFSKENLPLSPEAQKFNAQSAAYIAELKAADYILFALPMHNFTVSTLAKAYFDLIARAGDTFSYGPQGPKGLLTDKKVTVIASAGGATFGTAMDHLTPYVRDFLSFLGMETVSFIHLRGTAMSGLRPQSITAAQEKIQALFSSPPAARPQDCQE